MTPQLWWIGAGPLALVLTALWRPAPGRAAARSRAAYACAAAGFALALAVGTALAVILDGPLRTAPLGLLGSGAGFSLYLDALSALMFCLVCFVGLIVILYSRNYLEGDAGQLRFIRWLCLTLAAVLIVIISGNLLQFTLAWVGTSVGLNRLLVFYPERQAAILAARKKFIASRLGDLCLIGAMFLMERRFGTLDYATVFAQAASLHGAATPSDVHALALLLVLTAMLKSAQFPLHGWLIEVMETPTPVSALLHAGIINAGGFLVLRFADIISLSEPTLYTLAIVGGFTALFGSVVMLPQTSIKVSLAYSTVAQMGFMMLECGLGAYSAALLHILAHSLYKAHAFLSSGSVIDIARASWTPSAGGRPHPARLVIALLAVLAVTVIIAPLFGASLRRQPGVFALGTVLVYSLIHLVANGIDERPSVAVIARTVVLAAVVAGTYFALQAATEYALAGSLPPNAPLHGAVEFAIVAGVVLSFGGVTLFQILLPGPGRRPRWQRLYAHIANGLYLNTLANRWILAVWPNPPQARPQRAYPDGYGGGRAA